MPSFPELKAARSRAPVAIVAGLAAVVLAGMAFATQDRWLPPRVDPVAAKVEADRRVAAADATRREFETNARRMADLEARLAAEQAAHEQAKARAKAEQADRQRAKKDAGDAPSIAQLIGLVLAPLDDDLRKKFKTDADTQGVIVTEVDPQRKAGVRDVRVGNVITEVQGVKVATLADVAAMLQKMQNAGRKAVLLTIARADSGKLLTLELVRFDNTPETSRTLRKP